MKTIKNYFLSILFCISAPAFSSWQEFYAGKNVLITGGSSGIGRSLALKLSDFGAHVAVIARDQVKLDQILDDLKSAAISSQQNFQVYSGDVGSFSDVQDIAHQFYLDFRNLDILINCAGYCYPALLQEIPPKEIDGMIRTNLFGPVNVTSVFLKNLNEQKQAHIVNIASMAAFHSFIGLPVYAATKAGLLAFSRGLKNELANKAISVSVVFPPDTQTPGFDRENLTKPEITRKISQSAVILSPDQVAESVLRGVAQKKFQITPGFVNWVIARLGQHIPGCAGLFFDWQVRASGK